MNANSERKSEASVLAALFGGIWGTKKKRGIQEAEEVNASGVPGHLHIGFIWQIKRRQMTEIPIPLRSCMNSLPFFSLTLALCDSIGRPVQL